jgi:hypothetical protein
MHGWRSQPTGCETSGLDKASRFQTEYYNQNVIKKQTLNLFSALGKRKIFIECRYELNITSQPPFPSN